MRPLTLQQIRHATGARPLTIIPPDAPPVGVVCTNSRLIDRGCLFVALRGDRFDGHDFLAQAAGGGAAAALVDRPPDVKPAGLHLLQVADTYVALGKLARSVRQQMRARVIAVAGSNGKTGTKLLIDAALRGKLRGTVSPKSFNNRVGVPVTIFPADPLQDYLVLEMGTNHPGEIIELAEMALPDVAVITNCGAEHLEGLGDLMGVRRENAQVVAGLNPKGMLVVNGDDRDLVDAVGGFGGQTVTFGFDPGNDLFAADVRCDEAGVRFRLNGRRDVFVPLLGAHTACNALAAIAVGRKLGVTEDAIVDGLAHAEGPDMRLQLRRHGDVTVLNDAYNANPNSMRAALDTLAKLSLGARRVAVLGDMLELGPAGERYHREVGELAAAQAAAGKLDVLACVGPLAAGVAAAAVAAGFPAVAVARFPDSAAAASAVTEMLQTGDLVLLKGSRGVRLEAVADAIERRQAAAAQKAAS